MIITCPYCGPRDLSEFTYQGDATRTRPDPSSTDEAAWHAWVYERPNPAGWHREYWQHSGGCRAHLVVHRHTLTHEIGEVVLARKAQPAAPVAAKRTQEAAVRSPRTPSSKPSARTAKPKSTARPARSRAATRKGDAK